VVVGCGGFGMVVVVGCALRTGVVDPTVPTGFTVGTVVVGTVELLELDAACRPPHAPSMTAIDETQTKVIEMRDLKGRMAGP
jgi:hypothetical protein